MYIHPTYQGETMTNKTTRALDIAPTLALGADLSPALAAIEAAYRVIQARYPAPDVTIVIKRDSKAWGHTTVAHVWGEPGTATATRYEVMISGENLRRGAVNVAATLIHEAAHACNLAARIRDCDVNGRHNAKFRDQARLMGLTVEQAGWQGWTKTALDDEGAERWADVVGIIAEGLKASAVALPHRPVLVATGTPALPPVGTYTPPVSTRRRNLIKAECPCGYSIRASQRTLDGAHPRCDDCGERFQATA